MEKSKLEFAFRACCRGGSCPVIKVKDGVVQIEDDYGNIAKMTIEEFELMSKEFLRQVESK